MAQELIIINRFIRIEHVDLTGRSTRALKEPTHEMRQVRPCSKHASSVFNFYLICFVDTDGPDSFFLMKEASL